MYIDVWGLLHWVCLLMRARMWAFWDRSLFVFRFHVFWEWDEWLSLRSFVSLSFPSLHSLLMWLHLMLDLSGSSFLFVFFASPSSSFLLLIHHPHLTPCHFLTTTLLFPVWHFLHIILTHLIIRSIFFHCLVIDIIFTLGTLRSVTHEIFYTCGISYMRAWVSVHWVFWPSFPSFLSPYHPSLRYVPCLKTTRRPWDQRSSLTAYNWTGVWDLIDI